MYAAGKPYLVMNTSQIERIHNAAMRILAEMGMEIQNKNLLNLLDKSGMVVDFSKYKVIFPKKFVEDYINQALKQDWENLVPSISASAGVYHSKYLNPENNLLVDWSEDKLAFYFGLARALNHVGTALMLGCRLPVPGPLEPLYERLYCWKFGAREGSSIYLDEICPYLYELYGLYSVELGSPITDVFRGTVYLIPALKLGRHEAYQVAYFRERGLRVRIGGSMLTLGADAPVTLAGAVAVNLAEQLALQILNWILWGDRGLHFGARISVLDMRTTIRPFGRPEMAIANLMMAQIARYYGASFSGHAGLSDAKLPSVEAGAQKAISAVATLMASGSFWMDAGLLSIDEICSPIQMVLDNEFLSVLKRFTHPFNIDDEAINLEGILEAGPGGQYIDKEHTAKNFRREHWIPTIWSRQMLNSWLEGQRKIDLDFARDVIVDIQKQDYRMSRIGDRFEKEILALIARAQEALL